MSFLLDTNVVSEWMKPRPNAGVVAWLADVDEDRVFLRAGEARAGAIGVASGAPTSTSGL